MTLTVQATYENGVLKPTEPLPLKEHEKVQVTLHTAATIQAAVEAVQRSYGLLGWTGTTAAFDRLLQESEHDFLEDA
jgi:predicted DNA-binding antitoxin AbrB/MazE fold protein